MLAAKELLTTGLRISIGIGESTFVWKDPWLPVEPPRAPNDCGVFRDPLLEYSS